LVGFLALVSAIGTCSARNRRLTVLRLMPNSRLICRMLLPWRCSTWISTKISLPSIRTPPKQKRSEYRWVNFMLLL